jgi:hypothetical protein
VSGLRTIPRLAASARVGPAGCRAGLDELLDRVVGRIECLRRVRGLLLGLMADLPHRNAHGRAAATLQGTARRIQNAQVAVYLTYAAGRRHALIDRAVPSALQGREPRWGAAAGGAADVPFATKPALARVMLIRALDAGVPAA